MNNDTQYKLSIGKTKFLFGYFITLFFVGFAGLIISLLYERIFCLNVLPVTEIAIIGGFSSALIGNTIFYIRKLYKFCINDRFQSPTREKENFNQLGILFYFIARPLFAVSFSLLIHIVLKSSVNFIAVKEVRLDTDFIYFNMLLSFICGFATGDFITFIELKAKQIINNRISI